MRHLQSEGVEVYPTAATPSRRRTPIRMPCVSAKYKAVECMGTRYAVQRVAERGTDRCIRKCSCAVLHAPALHCIRLQWRRCAGAVRFYRSCQGVCETPMIEFGFVGVDRPGGTSSASNETATSRNGGPRC